MAAKHDGRYDSSWHRSDYWIGEYLRGFATAKDVTVKIRETLDPDAPKSVSCALRKGATYHPRNETRVVSDQLEFVTFSKIRIYEATVNFTAAGLLRQPDGGGATIEFRKGDRWSYLADAGEDNLLVRIGDATYLASRYDFSEKSTEVDPPVSNRKPDDLDSRTREEDWLKRNHQWVKLKCANGAVGWIFYNEIIKAPGFSRYSSDYANDEQPQPKSRSSVR